jgi:LPS export ABC transporter permease LptG
MTQLEMEKKVAFPAACVVLALAGMPLGIATRRGGRPAAFATSLAVIVLWYSIYLPSEAWMKVGRLTPWVAAWLPNAVVLVVAVMLITRMRRQQAVGLYRAAADLQLFGAVVLFLLVAVLLYERSVRPEAAATPFPLALPVTGGVLLLGHLLFRLFPDPIARRLARATESIREPRPFGTAADFDPARWEGAPSDAAVPLPADEPHDVHVHVPIGGRLVERPLEEILQWTLRRRRQLLRVRAAVVFALLAMMVFVTLEVTQHEDGVRAGLGAVVGSWQGVAVLVLLASCGVVQELGVPVFRSLDWWVIKRWGASLLLVTASIYVLWAMIDYLQLASAILQNDAPLAKVLSYVMARSPQMLFDTVPWAAMIAALVTFGVMTRFNEITALRCSGVSIYRLAIPVFVLAAVISAGAFVVHDYVLPHANVEAQRLRDEIQGKSAVRTSAGRLLAFSSDGTSLYHCDTVLVPDARRSSRPAQIFNLTVVREAAGVAVRDLLVARSATWDGTQWIASDGWKAHLLPSNDVEVTRFTTLPLADLERPDYFAAAQDDPRQMSFAEYRQHVEERTAAGYPTGELQVRLHEKVARPLQTLVVLLIGLPFGFMSGRRGALYGVGVALVLVIVFFAAAAFFTALGSAGYLPPVVAAWAPSLLFAVAGAYLLLTIRT